MNKELIKKYKTEFDHWLNGGALLFKPIGLQIFFNTITSPIDWSVEGLYIINDEYVEFRKALAEGKTIQYNPLPKNHNKWNDIKQLKPANDDTIENYRINLDKPAFKVGDWVKLQYTNTPVLIGQIKKLDISQAFIEWGNGRSWKSFDKLQLWQPKEGEWVCSIKDTDSFEVYRYKHYTNPRPCQPFIGTLPEGIACN